MGRQIIMIWGGAILLYLLLFYRQGTASGLKAFQSFISGTTMTLQARD
jgi:hypothetical protein